MCEWCTKQFFKGYLGLTSECGKRKASTVQSAKEPHFQKTKPFQWPEYLLPDMVKWCGNRQLTDRKPDLDKIIWKGQSACAEMAGSLVLLIHATKVLRINL